MNTDRDEECLQTLARLRGTSTDDLLVRIEYLEIKSLHMFEVETAAEKYPQWQDGSFKSRFNIGLHDYLSLLTNKSLFKRTTVAVRLSYYVWCLLLLLNGPVYDHGLPAVERHQRHQLLRVSQFEYHRARLTQPHSPYIFDAMKLAGNTTSLLATGVVGIVEFVFTIPAVLWVDQIGRKKILIAGAIGMAVCHFIVAGIIGAYQKEFLTHPAAGWAAIVFVWIFVINFAYSWGKPAMVR